MARPLKKRRWLLIVSLHLWWLLLSGRFLWNYWTLATIGGADGSGHVAALHLYAIHVYPDIQGWLPEFFGGMPFPIYYPPLFYWLGATLMKFSGIDATLAAKLLTTASFAGLPGALFGLGRRLGLSSVEATMSSAWAGVIACGSNLASLGGVGLLGLFEVGLYTHTLGFLFFCVWCGALPHARRSRAAAALATISLTALILTNVHVLPLAAAFAFSWLIFDCWRSRSRLTSLGSAELIDKTIRVVVLLLAPILIASIWLIPLIRWYTYSIGRPLEAPVLFSGLGALNVVWPICLWVAWSERRRKPALASLCVALLLVAVAALTPLGGVLKMIPFQPARVVSGAILLCTVPGALLISRTLRDLVGGGWLHKSALVLCVVALALVHPWQNFGIASLSPAETDALGKVRSAVRDLPPGMVLVEIVKPNAIFNSAGGGIRELATSRALAHQIAMDQRPILWSIFREQAITAPLATAVTNLFSTSQENFEIDGTALSRAANMQITPENAFKLASHLGVVYYLVNSPEQVERLQSTPSVRLLWNIEGWYLFLNLLPPSPAMESVSSAPVVAWMAPHFKNRWPDDIDLFNLWEELAFDGHPEVSVLWAQSPTTDPWSVIARLPAATIVIYPSSLRSANDEWLFRLNVAAPKLNVLLIDDGSELARQVEARKQSFAAYQIFNPQHYASGKLFLVALSQRIAAWEQPSAQQWPHSLRLWRTNVAYFPAWTTGKGSAVFLTGQGGMAMLDSDEPSLRWHSSGLRLASMLICLLGIAAVCWTIYSPNRFRRTPD
ncbi:MAG: hypothetical protein QOF62_2537 [Pyrinomonadaceae bacterium]|nr:hypothetical protein [Pyrinomonadaceae bacterium]